MTIVVFILTIIVVIGVNDANAAAEASYHPQEPSLPGMMPGFKHPRLIMAQDINWPPYAYLATPPEADYELAGFVKDILEGMSKECGFEVTVV